MVAAGRLHASVSAITPCSTLNAQANLEKGARIMSKRRRLGGAPEAILDC